MRKLKAKTLLFISLIAFFSIFLPKISQAATNYYVSTSGNDSNTGTSASPWRTIQKAANTMLAGDTVAVLAGSYASERINVTRSGSAGAMITFQAQGTVTMKGFTITANYIAIKGFYITGTDDNNTAGWGIYYQGSYGLIENNHVYFATRGGIKLAVNAGSETGTANCIVRNNKAEHNQDVGIEVHGRNNLIESNEVWNTIQYHPNYANPPSWVDADAFRFFGSGHTFKNNYIHDILYGPAGVNPAIGDYNDDPHIDCFQTFATDAQHEKASYILFEGNLCNNPDTYPALSLSGKAFESEWGYNLTFKNNVVIANLVAIMKDGSNLTFINNTFYGNPNNPYSQGIQLLRNNTNVTVKNNIFAYQENGIGSIWVGSNITNLNAGYNCVYRAGGNPWRAKDPSDVWGLNPLFVNEANNDYRLQSTSPCIDKGTDMGVSNDFNDNFRPQGAGYDIGAYEYIGTPSDIQTPTVPANLTASAVSSTQINLSWTASTDNVGVTGYRIYRCQGTGCTPSTQINTSTTNSYSDTGLTASVAYVYRVVAYDATGNASLQSSSASAATQTAGPIIYYVSSSSGNDSDNGTSQSTPWKTIAKVNSKTFSPGDSILFKRGDIWINEPLIIPSSGTQGNPITFGAFGTGALPKFDGNNQEHWAGLIQINGKSWVTIENLEITNVGKQCLNITGPSTGVTIQNNEIHKNSYVGYMLIYVDSGNILGNVTQITIKNNHIYNGLHNSMRLTGGVTYATINNNTIHGFYHNGIDTYPGSINNSNFTISGNNIYDVKCGIYLPGMSYATVYENDIHDDWKGIPEPSYPAISYGIKLDATVRAGDHNTIRNNRIWNITTADNNTYAIWVSNSSNNNIWNNTVYNNYDTILAEVNTSLSNQNNLAYANTYDQTAMRNYSQDPKFINATNHDFHLQASSPVINKGVNVGLPYSGSAPDLGAFEYAGSGDTTPPAPPSGVVAS